MPLHRARTITLTRLYDTSPGATHPRAPVKVRLRGSVTALRRAAREEGKEMRRLLNPVSE